MFNRVSTELAANNAAVAVENLSKKTPEISRRQTLTTVKIGSCATVNKSNGIDGILSSCSLT